MKFRPLPRQIIVVLLLVLTCAFSTRAINAAPIQGKIDFGGVVTYNTNSLSTATQVTQWNNSIVLQDSGDFANPTYNITAGDPATMNAPWTFNSGTVATPAPGPPLNGLWSIGGFTFDLSTSMVVSQSSTFLDVTGSGTISGNNFDPTPGTWSFTSTRSDGGTSDSFGFQAQSAAVPEPGSVVLLVAGSVITAFHLKWKARGRAH